LSYCISWSHWEHPHRWVEIWIGHFGLEPLETYFGHIGGVFFAPRSDLFADLLKWILAKAVNFKKDFNF
jgi:hypothetical protein